MTSLFSQQTKTSSSWT